jgi:hypothetical protein
MLALHALELTGRTSINHLQCMDFLYYVWLQAFYGEMMGTYAERSGLEVRRMHYFTYNTNRCMQTYGGVEV